ncbi:MAG: hypothetical protein WCY88_07925 [Spongiibacteraceae bacterium]
MSTQRGLRSNTGALVILALLITGILGCNNNEGVTLGTASLSESGAAPDSAIIFREHTITDSGMNNIVISTVLVPEGWTLKGGATRTGGGLFNMPVLIDVAITAPDERGIHFFPSLSFEFNYQQGNIANKLQPLQTGNLYYPLPESPGRWIIDLASLNPAEGVTNLRLVTEEDIPEISALLRRQYATRYQSTAQLNQTTASMGFSSEFDTQATKAVIQYNKNGSTIEETVVITWLYNIMIKQGRITQGSWSVLSMQSMSGPVGTNYLEDPALNAIYQSVRINPVWTAEMNKYWVQLANIKHKGNMAAINSAAKISQIQANAANDVSNIIMKGWSSRNASSDRIQAATVDSVWEQTIYSAPGGEAVKLPSFYDHVYTDGNGRYLLHNDTFYNPNRDSNLNGSNWERIEARR